MTQAEAVQPPNKPPREIEEPPIDIPGIIMRLGPGLIIAGHGNWLLWYYFLMFAAGIGQLGGIVGGVGQAMAISMPLTQHGREFNDFLTLKTEKAVAEAEVKKHSN